MHGGPWRKVTMAHAQIMATPMTHESILYHGIPLLTPTASGSEEEVPIPRCGVCSGEGIGEYWCKECDVDMCEDCMDNKPPEG